MLLLLWVLLCVALGSKIGSVLVPCAVFFGGVIGSEVGLKVAEIVERRVLEVISQRTDS